MAVALVLTLSSCSLGADEEAKPASGAPAALAKVVERLERATAAGEYRVICDELFTPAARERAGGRDCARLLRSSAREIERPSIEIRAIGVEDGRATVDVRTRTAGQPPVDDSLTLRRGGGEWRIEGLG
jgi:hypothetical protein